MSKFIEIPGRFLAEIAQDSDRTPRLYYAENWILRRAFWRRLHAVTRLLERHAVGRERGLDFGGGSGVMLPTLSSVFEQVTLVDLEASQAARVKQRYSLHNVVIEEGDASEMDFSQRRFDAAVAADVLEHFQDLNLPVNILKRWLKPDGLLFTSLPTENWLYQFLRKLFGVQKPWDHYHTGYEVEAFLEISGFRRVQTTCVPLPPPIAPLFLITAWRLVGSNES